MTKTHQALTRLTHLRKPTKRSYPSRNIYAFELPKKETAQVGSLKTEYFLTVQTICLAET